MQTTIIYPTDVFVETVSLNFWWAIHGFEPSDSEDITIYYKDKNDKLDHHSTEIITKGFLRRAQEYKDDEDSKEILEDDLKPFNKSLEEMLNANEVLYGYGYDDPNYKKFYEVEFEAKRNSSGIKPSYIGIFHPAESISKGVVKESVKKYCSDFLNIKFANVYVIDRMKRGYALKTYKKHVKERKEREEFIKRGGKIQVRFELQPLEFLFGEEELARFNNEIEYGFMKDEGYFVKLKDGSEHRIGPADLKIVKD